MKEIGFTKVLDYELIRTVKITNDMAPLSIKASSSSKVELEFSAKVSGNIEEFQFEDYVKTTYDGSTVSIELNELDIDDSMAIGKLSLAIFIPNGVALTLSTENHPLSISGLECSIDLTSENAPIAIRDCMGDNVIESENGPIALDNCNGNLKISIENGPLSADMVRGDSLSIKSENGPIKIREAQYPYVSITNENGVIYYETLPIEDGRFTLENENGIIHLSLPVNFDFEMEVETEYGSVKCKLDAEVIHTDEKYIIKNGEGKNKISIKTENGSIKLSSDGHINVDYIKQKLEQLKTAINNSKSFDDKERVQKLVTNIVDYINKNLSLIDEEKVKDTIQKAMNSLKKIIDDFDVDTAKKTIIDNYEEISSVINKELGEAFNEIKIKIERDFPHEKIKMHIHDQMGNIFDKDQFKKMFEPLKKFKHFRFDLNDTEKQEIKEGSRMKILDMLEAGKITSEDAEKLLKAIGKE